MAGAKFQKGERIKIVRGRSGVGVHGEIFWKGASKFGDGERFGMRGDDGETYWVDESEVEASDETAPEPEETYEKGDRVSFRSRGREGTGTVFWVGPSRRGPGQRLGVRDDAPEGEEDAVWLDDREVTLLERGGASGGASGGYRRGGGDSGGGRSGGDDEAPWTPALSMDELPPPAPIDDAAVDSWASAADQQVDEEDPGWYDSYE